MKAISEEYIPVDSRKTRTLIGKDMIFDKVLDADNDSQASGTGSQDGSPPCSPTGSSFSRDSKCQSLGKGLLSA